MQTIDPTIEVKAGQVWRGRLILDGPGQYASATLIANTLKASGAEQVWVWKSTDADTFPDDWPEDKTDDVSDFMEVQWFVQLRVGGDPLAPPRTFPTRGPNWRIHDAWKYLDASGVVPPEPKPPDPQPPDPETPDGEKPPIPKGADPSDIGDYAGRPEGSLDVWAPNVLIEAFKTVMGKYPTPQALQAIQAVGRTEGYYGWAGRPAHWSGHHNWGAITCRCPCGFESKDGYYVNGKWQPYTTCFAHRDTNLEGAIHLVEVLVLKRAAVQKVMDNGNLTDFARAMRDTTYFCRTTGKGKDGKPCCSCATDAQKQADAVWYAKKLDGRVGMLKGVNVPMGCAAIAANTGLPQVCYLDGKPGTVDPKDPEQPDVPDAPPAEFSWAGAATAGVLTGIAVGAGAIIVRSRKRRNR